MIITPRPIVHRSGNVHLRRYGWRPPLPGQGFRFARLKDVAPAPDPNRPPEYGVDELLPDVFDQGQLGSCVWNALVCAAMCAAKRQGLPVFMLSRLFGYQETEIREGTFGQDNGCTVADAVAVAADLGMCKESVWPYDPDKLGVQAGPDAVADAANFKLLQFLRVDNDPDAIRDCIWGGTPVIDGMTLFRAFESQEMADTGIMSFLNFFKAGHHQRCHGHEQHAAHADKRERDLFPRRAIRARRLNFPDHFASCPFVSPSWLLRPVLVGPIRSVADDFSPRLPVLGCCHPQIEADPLRPEHLINGP